MIDVTQLKTKVLYMLMEYHVKIILNEMQINSLTNSSTLGGMAGTIIIKGGNHLKLLSFCTLVRD